MKHDTDYSHIVSAIVSIIGAYETVSWDREPQLGRTTRGGSVGRPLDGSGGGVFTVLMNECKHFCVDQASAVIKHRDLLDYLLRVAFRNYQRDHSPSLLGGLRITREVINPSYTDVALVFIPAQVEHGLITYMASVPRNLDIDTVSMIPLTLDKLHYCYGG